MAGTRLALLRSEGKEMSFIGKNGFFGPLKPYTGAYHPSVYKRGGAALGTLGKPLAYKKPQLAAGGNVTGNDVLPRYTKQPPNNASNDSGSTYQSARGSNDYSWGKKTSRNNHAAQIEPTGHSETTRRSGMTDDYLTPAQRRAYESQARFAKGGKITPAWTDRPYHVKQRMAHSNSPRIHAEHSGEGLVLNIHLSDVGPHAITLGHSGGVDASRMVQRQASHALQSYGHPTPFHAPAGHYRLRLNSVRGWW